MEQHNTQVPESVTSGMGEGRSLHAAIMNLPCKPPPLANGQEVSAYQYGHRDARHAAAELALRSDAINAELLEALEGLMELERRGRFMPIGREWDNARAAIEKATA